MANGHELERWLRLFCYADNYHFGTLWMLKETLLKRECPGYDRGSTRLGHPGLSINRSSVLSLKDTIRMLIGISLPYGRSLAVTGVRKNSPPEKKTFFNVMRPVAVCPRNFFHLSTAAAEIERNDVKPRLDDKEYAELEALLHHRKGGGR
ncbi:MAG: hypothetical protein BWX73_01596 [Lentisphaerae bacterium ADurb.Bin082]|nr:MAG: hypothetical protein BWX73_01596 [Lentisphaerae bacterium ADurb.Bin082]HQL87665.1 hypothetical protein [Lentisphaeria bacterium]